MSKQGTYDVQGGGVKDTSFRSFICALLVFLALCIIIYLALVLVRNGSKKDEYSKEVETFEETNIKSERDRLTAINRPDDKEYEDTTTRRWMSRGKTTKATPRRKTTTKSYGEEENTIPQFIDEKEKDTFEKFTTVSTTVTHAQTTRRKTTTKNFREEENITPQFVDEKDLLEKFTTVSTAVTDAQRTSSKTTTPRSDREENNTRPPYINEKENDISEKYEPTTRLEISDTETSTKATGRSGEEGTSVPFLGKSEKETTTEDTLMTTSDLMHHGITTNLITSEESTTLDLGIDHEVFHRYSSTEGSENSTTGAEKFTRIYETTTEIAEASDKVTTTQQTTMDKSAKILVSREESTTESKSYVSSSQEGFNVPSGLTTTESLLAATENFQPNAKSSVTSNDVNNERNILDDYSSTTETFVTSEAEPPQSGNRPQNITASFDSEVTSSSISSILQNDTESITKISDSIEPSPTTETEDNNNISHTEHPQTTEKYTTDAANLKVKNYPASTTTTEMQTTLSTTTIHPATTHKSNIKTAGVPKKLLQVKQCDSTICKKVTSKMVNMMNHATDPCDNFYEFACGGQETDVDYNLEEMNFQALYLYMSKINASSEKYLRVFRRFYETCVEHERDFNFTKRMEFIGYFPESNLTELFVDLILTQSLPLFDVGLDIGGNQEYKLQLTLPGRSSLRAAVNGWSISDQIREVCLNEQKHLTLSSVVNLEEVYESFKNCQRRRFKTAATNFVDNMSPFTKDPTTTIFTDDNLTKMLNLLDTVQDMLPPENEIREAQVNRKFISIAIAELNKAYNVVDWTTILEKITFNSTFSENDYVDVYFRDIILGLLTHLHQYSEGELLKILQLYSSFQLYENTVIPKRTENREKFCMELSRQLMPDIVSTIIYDLAHHDRQLHLQNVKITMLFRKLIEQFKESLSNSKLDDTSKDKLLHKLGRIKLGLITTGNYNATRKNYMDVALTDSYQGNVIQLIDNYRNAIYSLERTKASASNLLIYFVDQFNTQPKSFYPSEYIVFHPTVFKRASMYLPMYLQLSKIGLHLSRELMRHFDPIGRKFLTDSQISSSDNYYNYLVNRTSELLVLYANSTYDLQGKTFNFKITGNLLINAMIADNAALRLIYNLFAPLNNQENLPWIFHSYSIEKVFFIAAAQEYCKRTTALDFMEDIYETGNLPSPLKIQNIVSNSKEFAEAFECVEGSAMTLYEELVTQFPYVNFVEDDYHTDPQFFS